MTVASESSRKVFRSGHAYGEIEDLLRGVERKGLCLDLPAGKGVNLEGIRRAGFEPVEADLYPGEARAKGAKNCVKMDFNRKLPFRDEVFEAVVCSEGIEHHPKQTDFIEEFARVLKPGGSLLITTPNILNFRARWSTLLNGHYTFSRAPISEVTQYWTGPDRTGGYLGHVHMVGYFALRFMLVQSGFDNLRFSTAKYSTSALLLAPLFWLPVRWSTGRLLGKYLSKHPEIRRELLRDACSPELLLGKKLIVLAQKKAAS